MLAGSAVAQAHEFNPPWGYAFIDDSPFNDPEAGRALLPSTKASRAGTSGTRIATAETCG